MHAARAIVRAEGHAWLGIQTILERMRMANELEATTADSFHSRECIPGSA